MVAAESAINFVMSREGLLENNASDPGGITNMGISLRFLKGLPDTKKYGIFDPEINADTIRHLTTQQAINIYRGEFWNNAPFEQLTHQDVANYLFDAAVNMGISPAIKCLQRALWAIYADTKSLADDGILGPQTVKMANSFSGSYLLPAMRSERAGDYRLDAVVNPKEKEDLNGWLNRAYNAQV